MSRPTRDGKPSPSCKTNFSVVNEDREMFIFPVWHGHEQNYQPYPVNPYSATYDNHTSHSKFYVACMSLYLQIVHQPCVLVSSTVVFIEILLDPE